MLGVACSAPVLGLGAGLGWTVKTLLSGESNLFVFAGPSWGAVLGMVAGLLMALVLTLLKTRLPFTVRSIVTATVGWGATAGLIVAYLVAYSIPVDVVGVTLPWTVGFIAGSVAAGELVRRWLRRRASAQRRSLA